MVQKLTTKPSFVNGRFVPAGYVVEVDEEKLSGKERNFADVDQNAGPAPVVEVAAIAPTGPNPVNPQQIPPDATQTVEGYVKPGAKLVGETTVAAEQRIVVTGIEEGRGSTAEGDLTEQSTDPLDHDADGKKGGSKPKK